MIYIDSYMFVFAAAVLQFGFNVDYSIGVCEAAIYSCLVCYVTTKVGAVTGHLHRRKRSGTADVPCRRW